VNPSSHEYRIQDAAEARLESIQCLAATASALYDIGGGCFGAERELRHVMEVLVACGVRRIRNVRDIFADAVEFATGNEHAVWFATQHGESRVIRTVHRPGPQFGHSLRLDDYLTRFEIGSVLFGDDVRIEGVDAHGAVYTSQRFIPGTRPSLGQIYAGMRRMGWESLRHSSAIYCSPDKRLVLSDMHTKNAIIAAWNGLLYPIDCVFLTAEQFLFAEDPEVFREAYEREPECLTSLWRSLQSPAELGFAYQTV
jgi:hypothetical protein